MTSTISSDGNPFADPGGVGGFIDTLIVGRNASLTLGTDSLIVLDEGFTREPTNCCGLIPTIAKTTKAVPFFNVLWAQLSEFDITIHYAHPASKDVVRVAFVNYSVEKHDRKHVSTWILKLLDRAYGDSQRNKRIKVLINPFGGNGSAQKWYLRDIEPIFAAAHCDVDVERTQFKGHAVDIAEKIDADAYDVIASCSGDGLPHEVFNGLGRKRNAREALSKVAVVQLPCGTGNAMSWNLNGTGSNGMAALCIVKGIRTPLDLISITQGDCRTLSFLSQSVGIVAESDLGTENLRWMGSARFTYGILVRLLRQTVYPCDLAVKVDIPDKVAIREHYRTELGNHAKIDDRRETPVDRGVDGDDGLPSLKYGSINDDLPPGWHLVPYDKLGNFYSGNMSYMAADANFFPAALPNDGHLDLVTIDGDIGRSSAVQTLLAAEKGTFFDLPHVKYRKISAYRLIPKGQRDGYISIDGEQIPFEPFQAEVHRGLGTTLSRSGHVYEAKGVCSPSVYIDST